MVAPLLFMVSMLGARSGDLGVAIVSTLVPALAGLSFVVLGGRLVLRPLFHHVAAAGSTEFFIAACLLVVIGTGLVTAMSGLSMGLGAFVAGILLAETEYRREIEVTIEPFKGLLLGLFFVSIGAGLDLSQVFAAPLQTFGLALGLILVKFCLTWLAAQILRLSPRVAAEAALLLAPGGEFAFVIISAAMAAKALPAAVGAYVMVAVTLSMFAVPALGALAQRLPRPRAPESIAAPASPAEGQAPEAILVGYGRVGRLIGEMLHAHSIRYIAVDTDASLVQRFRSDGIRHLLGQCGAARISRPLRHRQGQGPHHHNGQECRCGSHRAQCSRGTRQSDDRRAGPRRASR